MLWYRWRLEKLLKGGAEIAKAQTLLHYYPAPDNRNDSLCPPSCRRLHVSLIFHYHVNARKVSSNHSTMEIGSRAYLH